jgi:hypothetical protein
MTDDPSHRWHAVVGYKTEMEWSICTTTSMTRRDRSNWSKEAGLEHDYRDHDNPGDSVVRHNGRAIIRAVGGARTRSAQQSPTDRASLSPVIALSHAVLNTWTSSSACSSRKRLSPSDVTEGMLLDPPSLTARATMSLIRVFDLGRGGSRSLIAIRSPSALPGSQCGAGSRRQAGLCTYPKALYRDFSCGHRHFRLLQPEIKKAEIAPASRAAASDPKANRGLDLLEGRPDERRDALPTPHGAPSSRRSRAYD